MKITPRIRSYVWKFFSVSVLCVGLSWMMSSTSCKPTDKPPDSVAVLLPRENVVNYILARCKDCTSQLTTLELIIEPAGGSQDTLLARDAWRRSRRQYEMMRFAVEQFDPTDHRTSAAWFSTDPKSGMHFLEKLFFVPNPKMSAHETDVETIYFCTATYIPNKIKESGVVTDDGVFRGLQYMLADIDSLKLSGLDVNYANNSVADAISNLDGVDSVYSYYKAKVKAVSTTADTLFVSRLATAQSMLQTAGTLQNLDKAAFRANGLAPLQSSLKDVATALGITLP